MYTVDQTEIPQNDKHDSLERQVILESELICYSSVHRYGFATPSSLY